MHTIRVETNVDLNDQAIEDLIVTAFEGGINYWVRTYEIDMPKDSQPIECYYEALTKGGVYKIQTIDEYVNFSGDTDGYVTVTLTLEKLLNGIKQYCEGWGKNPDRLFNGDYGDYDADDADNIVQLAVFDEIIYG